MRYRERFIGSNLSVLWENARAQQDGRWILGGLTDNYLRVETNARVRLWNEFSQVRLKAQTGDGLMGEIVG